MSSSRLITVGFSYGYSVDSVLWLPLAGVVVFLQFILGNPASDHGAGIEALLGTQRKVDMDGGKGHQSQRCGAVQQEEDTQGTFVGDARTIPERCVDVGEQDKIGRASCRERV